MNDITTSATTSASPLTNKANHSLSAGIFVTHLAMRTPDSLLLDTWMRMTYQNDTSSTK